jgi:hypothetical protein
LCFVAEEVKENPSTKMPSCAVIGCNSGKRIYPENPKNIRWFALYRETKVIYLRSIDNKTVRR